MPLAEYTMGEIKLLDLVMSGEAARICGVDRRTFLRYAEKENLEIGRTEGKALFRRQDVEALAKRLKAEKLKKI